MEERYVEVLIERVVRVRACRVRGGGQYVLQLADTDDVRCVPAACSLYQRRGKLRYGVHVPAPSV